MHSWTEIGADLNSPILIVADHASAYVPNRIDLGIRPGLLATHIAVDIGVADLSTELGSRLDCPVIFAGVSRLVIDFNRDSTDEALIPLKSDGHIIPGNVIDEVERQYRIAEYWQPYHDRVAHWIARSQPLLIVSVHSFTPQLASAPDEARPWDIGILYNRDDRAACIAIPQLVQQGLCVGDQLPYSGVLLNATMNRHAEGNGIAYLGVEVRQDGISDRAGVARWAAILAPIVRAVSGDLAA